MANDDGGAMFYFDTNIDGIANDIVGALQRINASLAEPLRMNATDLAATSGGLSRVMSDMDRELSAGMARLREVARSGAPQEEVVAAFRNTMGRAFADTPILLANALGRTSGSVAASAPVKQLALDTVKGYRRALVDAVGHDDPALGKVLGKVKFLDMYSRLGRNPVAFGAETDMRSFYTNQLRAEGILRRDPVFGKDAQDVAARQGFSKKYMEDLRARTVEETETEQGTSYKFTPTDAAARLRDITRAAQDAETTGRRQARERAAEDARAEREVQRAERETLRAMTALHTEAIALNKLYDQRVKLAREAAAAERLVSEGTQQTGPGFRNRVGQYLTKTRGGAAETDNALTQRQIDEAITKQEEAAAQRADELATGEALRRRTFLQPDSPYVRNGRITSVDFGEHYQDTKDGGATQITDPNKVRDLDQRLASINAQQANAQRLLANWGDMVPVGQYRVLGQEVYKLSEYGAVRITEEAKVTQALEGQAAVMARQLALAERQLAAGQRQANVAARSAARSEGRQGGALTGFFNRLSGNQDQSLLNNVGSHIASAAQFTAGYGALFAVQGAIRDTIHEYLDYQDSMTDLQVATRNTGAVTQSWVNDLSDVARVTGENVGASLDVAARAVRAFADPMHASVADMQAIGSAAQDAGNKLALISGKGLQDATGDLIAVGTSFGFQPDQLDQVVDAVANAKRLLGGDPAQISQGLASIATSAQTSGFDVNQAADLISLVQSRVDETGLAAATRLTRIFQTVSGSTGKGLGAELGVDTNQSVRKQLEQYAAIYNDPGTSKATKDRITSQLGGTANLRELLAVLENGKDLQEAYGESARRAGGGTDEFNRKARSLSGTLLKITGDIKAIQTDFGRTDLGAPFAYAVYTAEPLLHLLDRILQLVDTLPKSVKIALGGLADIAIAAKAVAVVSNVREAARARGGIVGGSGAREAEAASIVSLTEQRASAELAYIEAVRAATAARSVVEEGEDAAILAATEKRVVAEGVGAGEKLGVDAAETAATRGGKGLFSGLGMLARGTLLNPWAWAATAVVGGGIAANQYLDAQGQKSSFSKIQASTSDSYLRNDGSSAKIGASIRDLQNAAGRIEKSDSNWMSATSQKTQWQAVHDQIKGLEVLQKRVATSENADAANAKSSIFGTGGAVTGISELEVGLDKLGAAGVTARTQLKLVEQALEHIVSPTTGQTYDPEKGGAQAALQIFGDLRKSLPKGGGAVPVYGPDRVSIGGRRTGRVTRGGVPVERSIVQAGQEEVYNLLQDDNQVDKIAAAYRAEGAKLHLKKGDLLDDSQRSKLARAAADALDLSGIVDPKQREDIRSRAYRMLLQQITAPPSRQEQLLNGAGGLDRKQIMTLINPSADGKWKGLGAMLSSAESSVPKTDDGTQLQKVQQANLRFLKNLRTRYQGTDQIGELEDLISNEEAALTQTAVARLEKMRAHDQNKKGLTKGQIRAIGRRYLGKEINRAAGLGDIAALIDIMDRADNASLDIIEKHLKAAAELAAHDRGSMLMNPSFYKPRTDGSVAAPPPKAGQTAAEKSLNAFQQGRRMSAPSNDPWGGDYAGGTDATKNDNLVKEEMTKEQLRALKARAEVNPTDTVGAARADIAVSLANLHAAQKKYDHKKGTLEDVYAAEQDLAEKRQAYTQSEVDVASAAASARAARNGGAIASARAQLQAAAAAMRLNAKRTLGWWQGLQSFYEGQEAMRQAVMEYHNNLDKLHGDITDPVENARDQLRADERALHAARNKEDRAAARVSIRQDRAGMQDAKFQQQMSDWDTDETLGRISFAKHMSLLDNEHNRLSKLHHRTRQQQDELDTVEKAIKDSLNSMDSQFNLGDINTNGLVYQVRRFKAEMAGGGATSKMTTAQATTNQTVTISINGADTAMVKRTIDGYLRIQGGQRKALTRRKV